VAGVIDRALAEETIGGDRRNVGQVVNLSRIRCIGQVANLSYIIRANGIHHRLGILVTIDSQRRKAERGRQKQHGHDRENAECPPVAAASRLAPTPDAADQRDQADQADRRIAGQVIPGNDRNGDNYAQAGDNRRNPGVAQPVPRKGRPARLSRFPRQPAVDPKRRQDGQRRVGRQQVMRQLCLADRPEYQPYAEPADGKKRGEGRGERSFFAQALDGVDQRRAEENRPGEKAEQYGRDVIEIIEKRDRRRPDVLQRAGVAVAEDRLFEGAKVEFEKELPQPLPVGLQADHDVPGQCDRRDYDDGRQGPHLPGRADRPPPAPLDQHEQAERGQRQHHAHRTLGQHGQAEAAVHQRGVGQTERR